MKINDTIPHLILKVLRRKIYPKLFQSYSLPLPECEQDVDKSNDIIYNCLSQNKPCMVARLGATEMSVISNYLYVKRGKKNTWKYIQGKGQEWWWNENTLEQLRDWSGVWPVSHETAEKFAKLSIEDAKQVDVLGSWLPTEALLSEELKCAQKVQLFNMEPFFSSRPWTKILSDKKVLVVHPFTDTIEKQYKNREKLFGNKDILPKFELKTFKAVQSLGGSSDFKDWFDALKYMEDEIDKIDYDVAILACGAYGFNLAAYIKRQGKQAVHLGGVTQILFGIKGKRWEYPVQKMCRNGYYPDLFNEYWIKPASSERPKSADVVENACYW